MFFFTTPRPENSSASLQSFASLSIVVPAHLGGLPRRFADSGTPGPPASAEHFCDLDTCGLTPLRV